MPHNYGNGLDLNGDGVYNAVDEQIARLQARQLYARHLYVLMMLVMDRAYVLPMATEAPPIDKRRDTAKRIAQWAINVVDYADADSIMTPFEFDYEPFVHNARS